MIDNTHIEKIAQLKIENNLMELLTSIDKDRLKFNTDKDIISNYFKNLTSIIQEMLGDEVSAPEAIKEYLKRASDIEISKKITFLFHKALDGYYRASPEKLAQIVDPFFEFGLSLKLCTRMNNTSDLSSEIIILQGYFLKFDSCMLSEITEEYDLDPFARIFKEKNLTLKVDKDLFSQKSLQFAEMLERIRNLDEIVSDVVLAQYKIKALNTRNTKIKEGVNLIAPILEKQKLEMSIEKSTSPVLGGVIKV